MLDGLRERCQAFAELLGAESHSIELIAEARPGAAGLAARRAAAASSASAATAAPTQTLIDDFRRLHEEIFAVLDERSAVEIVALRARVVCPLREPLAAGA